MDRVICIDFSDNLIEKTAGFITANYSCPSEAAVVFGGRRPSHFLRRELGKRLGGAFLPPRIFSGDEFAEYIVRKQSVFSRLPALEAYYLIYKIAEEISPGTASRAGGFPRFLPHAEAIFSLIERTDLEDAGSDKLRNIEALAGLGLEIPAHLNKLLSEITVIRNRLHEVLEQRGTFSRGLIYLKASRAAANFSLAEFKGVLFCGMFYLHRTEIEIARALNKSGKAVFIFQSRGRWPVLEETARQLGIMLKPAEGERRREPTITISACSDLHSQACLAREAIEKTGEMHRTVIVLPEANALVPVISEISNLSPDCNISMGYPVRRSILFSLLFLIMNAQKNSRGPRFYSKDYLRLISHPFPKNLETGLPPAMSRIIVHKIEEALRGLDKTDISGSLFISLREIESSRQLASSSRKAAREIGIEISASGIREAIRKIHTIFFSMWGEISSFSDFAAAVEKLVLFLLESIDFAKYPIESAAAEKLLDSAEELRDSSFSSEPFGRDEIFRIFEEHFSGTKISFPGTPLKGMQILGFLETRCLAFKNVIFLDLNEGVLPASNPYEPLVPAEILSNMGIKDIKREEEVQRYHFRRLINSAENVRLLYKDDDKNERSRFIEEIIWEDEKPGLPGIVRAEKKGFRASALPAGSGPAIEKTADIISFLKEKIFSASSLNAYTECPLKFCLRYVLGIQEERDMLEEPEAAEIGSFVHELLEGTFRKFLGKRPVIDDGFFKYFNGYFSKFFAGRFSKRMPDAFMLKKVIENRMKRFLEKEKGRNVRKILHLEENFSGFISSGTAAVKFTAVLDRVDLMEDGSLFIADYKTGAGDTVPSKEVKRSPALSERAEIKRKIRSFQLPLYIHSLRGLYPGKTVNAGFYNLRNAQINSFFAPDELPESETILAGFMESAGSLVDEILNIEVPFAADRENQAVCRYCPYGKTCG